MRINKYRAFKDGKWWYSDDEAYVLKQYDNTLYLCEDVKYYKNNGEFELEIIGEAFQYSGKDDKNGVEIYEGNIIKQVYDCFMPIITQIKTIEFLEDTASFMAVHLDGFNSTGFEECQEWEIIGNTKENKDLLKDNK